MILYALMPLCKFIIVMLNKICVRLCLLKFKLCPKFQNYETTVSSSSSWLIFKKKKFSFRRYHVYFKMNLTIINYFVDIYGAGEMVQ